MNQILGNSQYCEFTHSELQARADKAHEAWEEAGQRHGWESWQADNAYRTSVDAACAVGNYLNRVW